MCHYGGTRNSKNNISESGEAVHATWSSSCRFRFTPVPVHKSGYFCSGSLIHTGSIPVRGHPVTTRKCVSADPRNPGG